MSMKAWWEKLKAWWHPLSLREKQAVAIGGSLLFIFLVYQCMWKPYLNHMESMRQRIISEQKTLLWMQSADKIMQMGNKSSAKSKSVSLVVFLSQMQGQIKLAGLEQYLTQLKQSANDSIEIHFQKVEFDKLITFLIDVMKKRPVSVTQMLVIAGDAPGYVSADIAMKQV